MAGPPPCPAAAHSRQLSLCQLLASESPPELALGGWGCTGSHEAAGRGIPTLADSYARPAVGHAAGRALESAIVGIPHPAASWLPVHPHPPSTRSGGDSDASNWHRLNGRESAAALHGGGRPPLDSLWGAQEM